MKEIGPWGERASLAPTLDPPMLDLTVATLPCKILNVCKSQSRGGGGGTRHSSTSVLNYQMFSPQFPRSSNIKETHRARPLSVAITTTFLLTYVPYMLPLLYMYQCSVKHPWWYFGDLYRLSANAAGTFIPREVYWRECLANIARYIGQENFHIGTFMNLPKLQSYWFGLYDLISNSLKDWPICMIAPLKEQFNCAH